jgi:hypothetical protein
MKQKYDMFGQELNENDCVCCSSASGTQECI